VITNLCEWLCTRKHDLALAAIEHQAHAASARGTPVLNDVWLAGASHIALQLQRAYETKAGNKGRTVLVFNDNKRGLSDIADLVYDPPAWTDDYYDRQKKAPALHRLVDTPFAVKSHHVALVQVADIFAAIFLRHSELADKASRRSTPANDRTLPSGSSSSPHNCWASSTAGPRARTRTARRGTRPSARLPSGPYRPTPTFKELQTAASARSRGWGARDLAGQWRLGGSGGPEAPPPRVDLTAR